MDEAEKLEVRDDYDTPEKRVAAWNAYREANPEFVPDLRNAKMSNVVLGGIDLENANLTGAHLEKANLTGAHLEKANLRGAHLEKANLRGAHLENARLESADLESADLENADLENAHLDNADLRGARLENANLREAHLKNADLQDAHCEGAQLLGASGYRFDETFIRDCLPSSDSQEPWLVLRLKYTGPKLVFILFLLSIFLVPYAAKTFWWVGVNKGQIVALQAAEDRRAMLHDRLGADPLAVAQSREALAALSEADRYAVLALDRTVGYLESVGSDWETWRAWQLILGVDKGWPYWITAALILAYNFLRILLTWQVSHLRQDEELRGPSPVYRPRAPGSRADRRDRIVAFPRRAVAWSRSVVFLMWCHRVATALVIVALGSGAFHLWYWLTRPVLLPG